MGSTVTTGRRVGAFTSSCGKTIYVLAECTYEKNCTPHTPSWSCIGIGEISDVIRRIFAYGSSCEGGMLQNRNGHISPEGYIRSWLEELKAPLEMRDFQLDLKAGTGFYDTVQKEKIESVSEALIAIGRVDISTALLAGRTFTVSFQKDATVVLALYGLNGAGKSLLSPWLAVHSHHLPSLETDRNASLGYEPKPAASDTPSSPDPVVYRVGNEDCFVQHADGSLRAAGWAYSLVGHFIENLWKEEMLVPRSFARRIKTFRDTVTNAPRLSPDALTVTIDTTVAMEHAYEARVIAEFQRDFPESVTGKVFVFQPNAETFYRS
ncbi:MAG: hypothetical protein ROO76_08445 [Terriglobia bacterium]|nr:hypothetical protein [Terriglobia bacterium]